MRAHSLYRFVRTRPSGSSRGARAASGSKAMATIGRAAASSLRRAIAMSPACPFLRRAYRPTSDRSPLRNTSGRRTCPGAECWWSAPPHRAFRSPTNCGGPVATSSCPSVGTSDFPAATGTGTSCGGSIASASLTSGSRTCPTSTGPAPSPRSSWSGGPTGEASISQA